MSLASSEAVLPMERDLLVQLNSRWGKRVAVKRDELDLDGHFDAARPDFPEHMVPLPWLTGRGALDLEARQKILGAAWIAYNAKTSAVEEEIVLPACQLMLRGDLLPGRRDDVAKGALRQTIIDEHYHILMCHNAAAVTRRRRELGDLDFTADNWSVVRRLNEGRRNISPTDANLVLLAFSLAAETTISDFLMAVSKDYDIQSMNRLTVELHRQDESGHAVAFRELVGAVYRELAPTERDLFKNALADGLAAFRSADLAPWSAVAAVGDLTVSPEELAEATAALPAPFRDSGPLRRLLMDLGIVAEFGKFEL